MGQQRSIFDSMKNEGPEASLAYLRHLEQGEGTTAPGLLLIFTHSATLAKQQESLGWAEVAIRAAELDARTGGNAEREESLLSAMSLRSWFISRMGSHPGHFVLDKQIVLRWIMDGLQYSLQTTREKAFPFWERFAQTKESSNPEEMRQIAKDLHDLRWIKHRLHIAKALADCDELPGDSVLHEWLQLRERLP